MMDGLIDLTAGNAGGALGRRHEVATTAMRRYVPYVVAWDCPAVGEPISVTLPNDLSVRDLRRRAARVQVAFSADEDPASGDRSFQVHYAHLAEAEIEEGIRRLGYCLARYAEQAARFASGNSGSAGGL